MGQLTLIKKLHDDRSLFKRIKIEYATCWVLMLPVHTDCRMGEVLYVM